MSRSTAVADDHAAGAGRRHHRMLDDAQWAVLEPFFPESRGVGRRPEWSPRLVLEAVLYVFKTGCQWRCLPAEFPPRSTVNRWLGEWSASGFIDRINHRLVMADRERSGREASPSAACIDSQSVKTSETSGLRGYDGGKKINGIKRHIMVDTDGRLLVAAVSAADLHDSKAAVPLLQASRRPWPFVERLFADAGYRWRAVAFATPIDVTVVTGPPNQKGFIVQKRRWVVERTLS